MLGEITDQKSYQSFSPHFWIMLHDGRYIDYRARMWLGEAEHIPHGIFKPEDYPISYHGEVAGFEYPNKYALVLMRLECEDSQL